MSRPDAIEQAQQTLEAVRAVLAAAEVDVVSEHSHRGDATVVLHPQTLIQAVRALRDKELAMDILVDLTAVDYAPGRQGADRFEVVYHFASSTTAHRVRLKLAIADGQAVPSLFYEYLIANWFEREVFDFYGISFDGHPDLRRILLYPEFEGYPLRKDYPKQGEQPRVAMQDHRPWRQPPPKGVG